MKFMSQTRKNNLV